MAMQRLIHWYIFIPLSFMCKQYVHMKYLIYLYKVWQHTYILFFVIPKCF